jgi:hypothetical protein
MAIPAIRITSFSGAVTNYTASADTDLARGTALLAAMAAAAPGDTIEDVSTAGTFDVGTDQISPAAGTAAQVTRFIGAGKTTTIIYSQRCMDGEGNGTACIKPNSHQEWRQFTLWANNPTTQQSPFGHGGDDFESPAYTNVLLSDARIIAAVDCIHMTQVELQAQIRCVRCDFYSSFDTVACFLSGAGSSLELINCTANATYPHPTYPYPSYAQTIGQDVRALTEFDANCSFVVHGGTYTVGGGGSSRNSAMPRSVGGTPKLYGVTLSSTGTNALDIEGDTTVGDNTVYDPAKTSGTITVESAWAPAPPTDLVVSASGRGAVELNWINNATNETAITYEWATNTAFSVNLGSGTTAPGVSSARVTGLTAGTRYYFRVRASNATGNSGNSNRATMLAPSAVPSHYNIEQDYVTARRFRRRP